MKSHSAAEIFPLMCGAEFDGLVEDIRDNGQREPIVIHEDQILDGRNRYRACEQIGIVPLTVQWDGNGGTPETFVLSMNYHRRHLNEGQRAIHAARLVTTKSGARADYERKKTGRALARPVVSTPEAAALLGVSAPIVYLAQTVLAKGTPEEIAAIERGELALSTTARKIQKGVSPDKRKKKLALSQTGRNVERIQRAQMQAEIWASLNDALIGLTSLPLPSEVAELVAANHKRRAVVDARLARALQYLKDLDDAWRNRD